jgi:aspartate/methionine/tyrosine aminotransferase
VPTPSQWQATTRFVVDRHSGLAETKALRERWEALYEILGVVPPDRRHDDIAFVPYYAMFDVPQLLDAWAETHGTADVLRRRIVTGRLSAWEDFYCPLAEAGVAVMPAARFFEDALAHEWTFRVSVANQPLERVELAAERIRDYLGALAHVRTPAHRAVLA